jgi:hypothetical protein
LTVIFTVLFFLDYFFYIIYASIFLLECLNYVVLGVSWLGFFFFTLVVVVILPACMSNLCCCFTGRTVESGITRISFDCSYDFLAYPTSSAAAA